MSKTDTLKQHRVVILATFVAVIIAVISVLVVLSRQAPQQDTQEAENERFVAMIDTSIHGFTKRAREQLARSAGTLPEGEVQALTIVSHDFSTDSGIGIYTVEVRNGSSWEVTVLDVRFLLETGETPENDTFVFPSTATGLLPHSTGTFHQVMPADYASLKPSILSARGIPKEIVKEAEP